MMPSVVIFKPFKTFGFEMIRFKFPIFLALILCSCICSSQQIYPNKVVKIVVPWTAGQATDVASRAISEALSSSLNQPFVIDNKAGAGGAVGSEFVAKSSPDGYTLLAGFGIPPNL